MGWLSKLINAGKYALQHNVTTSAANYLYKTVRFSFTLVGSLPETFRALTTNHSERTVGKHLLRIAAEDLILLVPMTLIYEMIHTHNQERLKEQSDLSSLISSSTLIEFGLYTLQTAFWILTVRMQIKVAAHMIIVNIEAPAMLNTIKTVPKLNTIDAPIALMNVCIDEKCSQLRITQGVMRDATTYWATEALFAGMNYYSPVVGAPIANALAIYHRGRYVLTAMLPELCDRHKVAYLRNNSELALSLGVGHAAASAWFTSSMLATTGIPSLFYYGVIEQLMLIVSMAVVPHLTLPIAQKESTRFLPDPLFYYQSPIGFLFDTILLGLKAQIPKQLHGKQPGNLKEALTQLPENTILKVGKRLHDNPLARLFLPELLHNATLFIQDPIISYHWPSIKIILIDALKMVDSLQESAVVKASSYIPNITGPLVQKFSGVPTYVTRLALQLVDKDIHKQIKAWAKQMEAWDPLMPFEDLAGSFVFIDPSAASSPRARLCIKANNEKEIESDSDDSFTYVSEPVEKHRVEGFKNKKVKPTHSSESFFFVSKPRSTSEKTTANTSNNGTSRFGFFQQYLSQPAKAPQSPSPLTIEVIDDAADNTWINVNGGKIKQAIRS